MEKKFLKSYIYYSDLYDQHTVEHCRRMESSPSDTDTELETEENTNASMKRAASKLILYFETGERYLKKKDVIAEWMERDRKKDELFDSAEAPEDIRCLTCRNRLNVSSKHLWPSGSKEDRVLFIFDCPNHCLPHRAFYSDGEERRSEQKLCPNCHTKLQGKTDEQPTKIKTTYTCSSCAYSKTEELNLTPLQEEQIDENFATDRDRFCLSDEKGTEYREEKGRLEGMKKLMEEISEKEKLREEKLKLNPQGFHLEGQHRCCVCRETTGENGDNWYDQYGIKCLVCQKAIDVGEIPATVASDEESWYSEFDLEQAFNLTYRPLQKWIKKGIIKPRIITKYGEGVHAQIFLIEDNKGFLPPKELVKSRQVRVKQESGEITNRHYPWYQVVEDAYAYLKEYKIIERLEISHPEKEERN